MAALIENYQAFFIQITVSFIKECLAKGDVTTSAQLFSKVWHRIKFDPDFMYATLYSKEIDCLYKTEDAHFLP